jgi:transcriptional regulator with GAF, ATPase, and Fis domain
VPQEEGKIMDRDDRERLWLSRVCKLCHLLASETESSTLFSRIIDAAIELTGARRGFLVLIKERKSNGSYHLHIEEARGFDQMALQGAQGSVSRTAVSRVLETGQSLVSSREQDADIIDVSSVQSQQVLSIICVPMRLRGLERGVIYLDHRSGSAFSERDVPILETFANQAALALENCELQGKEPTSSLSEDPPGFGLLMGQSTAMKLLYKQIERVSRSWEHVLITGESGTGKELVARELHNRGSYPNEAFLSENVAAIPDSLLESELFGHTKGAFTGAVKARKGLFLEAGRGTLFLDEVGDMSLVMQAKLLRVLQERQLRPVGGHKTHTFSCRVLAATHHDLSELVKQGRFREDLFYRLDVLRLHLPPLRSRPEDISLLISHFAGQIPRALTLSEAALSVLKRWRWPGNVRELQNEVRRLALNKDDFIDSHHLSVPIDDQADQSGLGLAGRTLQDVEREMVKTALESCQWNKSRAARQLGVPRSTLYSLMRRYGLES